MSNINKYDVIVVGGGHAGVEAALASARMGASTALITHNIETIGHMSCNPAIGGIGKGHLVKEIDALGGVMAKAADHAGIHFKMLNSRKGPAVRSTRAQADRNLYRSYIRNTVETQDNLQIIQQSVDDVIINGHSIHGVITQIGFKLYANAVILTAGTFLSGRIHVGLSNYEGGRSGEPASVNLAMRLRELYSSTLRLKTGTPPRLDKRSINFSHLEIQPGDNPTPIFSFIGLAEHHPRQVPCHIARTTTQTHEIILSGLSRSPMYTGVIEGVGPRYCPSIEDKVVRFSDKNSHQIFVEPEGLNVGEIYPNGISTSLPYDIQQQLVNSIKGFENAHITRPGYAIEYDYFDPRQLFSSLESRHIRGLYFAGQINGTTGYEEAASQGLLAGINAARHCMEFEPWVPHRDEAYIGVMVDDLTTTGITDPYRMFTSRAEYRLLLREDNADARLTPLGRKMGLIDEGIWKIFASKQEAIDRERKRLSDIIVRPGTLDKDKEISVLGSPLTKETRALELLQRPSASYSGVIDLLAIDELSDNPQLAEQLEIQIKYAGYIDRQFEEVKRASIMENERLPDELDYMQMKGLSEEVKEKLTRYRPETVGKASRIPGITPAAISILLIYLKKNRN